MIIYFCFALGLVLLVVASLVMWWFYEGLTREFIIVAAVLITTIVLPILTVFVLLAMYDMRRHGGFYDLVTGNW